ncbi:MAG: hypothetical protein HYZ75_18175 [Elusimicrobia bacterium]|nr:hypothetical protein [Elusimicrobiota bacterium]
MTLSTREKLTRPVAAGLSAALLLVSPGPLATNAVAQVIAGNAAAGRVVPTSPVGVVPALAPSVAPRLSGPSLLTLGSALPTTALPTVNAVVPAAVPNAIAVGVAPAAAPVAPNAFAAGAAPAAPAAAPASSNKAAVLNVFASESKPAAPITAKGTLEAGAKGLQSAGRSGAASFLDSFFTGSRNIAAGFLNGVTSDDSSRPAPQSSGLSAPVAVDYEGIAKDSAKSEAERVQAVSAVAKQGGDEAKAALIRISEANPEGGAADYEVHRAGLKALAETFGEVRSLRAMSRAHADQVLSKLAADKPELYITDYDDTLQGYKKPLSRANAASLKAVADAGIETVIHTDRPALLAEGKKEDDTVTRSIAEMTAEEKSAITVVSDRGTRIQMSGRDGQLHLVYEEKVSWTDAEKAAINEAKAVVAERYGSQEFNGKLEDLSAYGYAKFLPIGLTLAQAKEAAALMQAELAKRGLKIDVLGRTPKSPTDAPYIMLSKIDKSIGVKPVRANRRAFEQMRDLLAWGLPASWAQKVWGILQLLPARPIPSAKTLLVGDQFFDSHNADMGFAKGAPGALALAVGGKADPRIQNIFVWPSQGETASMEIQAALAKELPSGFDKKAAVGLFSSRTISITGFILTSVAYPFVAAPVVGWATLGALMALGPLAAIATGPLNGLIVDRLSPRNAMILNTVIKAVLAFDMPLFAFFGVMNFWTLLLGSIGNGWLLSSIMTTEGAFIRRMAGKHLGTFNGLAWMNYLALQVGLNLILGVGAYVGGWASAGWIFAPFYISAALHVFLILPIIYFTVPNVSPLPKTLDAMRERVAELEGKTDAASAKERASLAADMDKRAKDLAKTIGAEEQAARKAQTALETLEAQIAAEGLLSWNGWRMRAQTASLRRELDAHTQAVLEAQVELEPAGPAAEKLAAQPWAAVSFIRSYWKEAALVAGAVASYPFLGSPIPITLALLWWIAQTDSFRGLWGARELSASEKGLEAKAAANMTEIERLSAEKAEGWEAKVNELEEASEAASSELGASKRKLGMAMLYVALAALLMYPLQYFGIPRIAEALGGAADKHLLTGQFLGALFFGNMIANAAQTKLPEVRLPFIGSLPAARLIQAGVAALASVWVYTGLMPGSLLAAGAAALAAAGLMYLASQLTNRGWIQLFGVGFSAIWLPYLAWTGVLPFLSVPVAMLLSLLAIGMFYGPGSVALNTYFSSNAAQANVGKMVGVQGSFFNAAISMGYGMLAMAAGLFSPVFPATLAVIGAAYLAGGALFSQAPKHLPGLPKTLTQPKEEVK